MKLQKRTVITRENILHNATMIFARVGYFGARIDKIATASNINKQRIYANFGSKSGLFTECLNNAFEAASEFDKKILLCVEKKPAAMTSIILNKYILLHKKHPYFWRLLAWANLESDPIKFSITSLPVKNYDKLKFFFDIAVKNGTIRSGINFETYIFTLLATSYFYHSNNKTLSNSLSKQIFSNYGRKKLIQNLSLTLDGQNVNR